jgi:hypothetical protein
MIDPDAQYAVAAKAKVGDTRYWVIDEFSEGGGQVLIRRVGQAAAEVLLRDTTVFPLPASIVAAISKRVADELSRNVSPVDEPPPPRVGRDGDTRSRLLATAKACDGTLVSRHVAGTNRGRLACAWAVNEVARRALGRPIGGGLSTARMADALKRHHTEIGRDNLAAGLVVISPTANGRTGHVGILGEIANPVSRTLIYSNSSSRGVFAHHFTLGSWEARYRDGLKLPVLFFEIA